MKQTHRFNWQCCRQRCDRNSARYDVLITLSWLSNQTTYHHYLNYRSSELNVIKHYFQSRIWSFNRSNHFISFIYWFQLVTVENWNFSSSPLLQPYHISHAHFMVSSPLVFFSLSPLVVCISKSVSIEYKFNGKEPNHKEFQRIYADNFKNVRSIYIFY